MLFIDSNKNAQKAIGELMSIDQSQLTKKQNEAINAVTDLLDELQIEGRW